MVCRYSMKGQLISWLMAWVMLCGGVGSTALFAQQICIRQPHHSYTVLYDINGSDIDAAFRYNGSVMNEMTVALEQLLSDTEVTIDSVVIASSSSPDGNTRFNYNLSVKRGKSVYDYIRGRFPQIPDEVVVLVPQGEDWVTLRHLVEQDMLVPGQEEVIRLLDAALPPEEKERRLKRMKQTYAYLLEHHMYKLRAATVAVHVTVYDEEPLSELLDEAASGLQPVPMAFTTASSGKEASASCSAGTQWIPSRWYVKTNLVYDLALMPSLEIEYRINERWSTALEGNMAWWHRDSEHWYYQLATIIPEVRYWFRPQGYRRGHYVGLFGGGGWHDLENGGRGYKGEGGLVGIGYGYQFPVGRQFAFEAGVGIGFMTTKYEEYLPIDGHYVYQQTSRTNFFGPLKLKFAFVWNVPMRKRLQSCRL